MRRKLPVGYVLLLTLLVGLNLSLVCQGHEHDDHITGLHLSFLGEPDEHDSPIESPGLEMTHDMHAEAHIRVAAKSMPESCAIYGSPSALVAGPSWVKSSEPAESEPFILGFVMPAAFLDGVHAFHIEGRQTIIRQSQVGVAPEPPPPRAL